ncbi:phosphoribosyl-AMP cyclohydrolase [Corynebacterium lizhenjunii]|uniref:Phosphoribosyl-AMP cyclohydrolase n=1 Tax=Corynebacterium lizhenjunii TaxID=2709394 RepID=A0A7T0PBE9_9CORY|nr:phosphoribosyl-AMP cyclohydrolase [Corynebacterium lizhenjunii]QPK78467.1 phosphoribosyl-AMP cyclohydrolase [Corynebacterium lizhenjunii]
MSPSIPGQPDTFELDAAIAGRLKLNDAGLLPAVVQSTEGEVLMLAWMDTHALAHTLATRQATYFSRSRNEYWIKGATSGHTQRVESVALDCDGDTILLVVTQTGGACHTGDRTCFDADILLAAETPQGSNHHG